MSIWHPWLRQRLAFFGACINEALNGISNMNEQDDQVSKIPLKLEGWLRSFSDLNRTLSRNAMGLIRGDGFFKLPSIGK